MGHSLARGFRGSAVRIRKDLTPLPKRGRGMGCVKVIRYLWRRLAMRVLKPRVVDVDSSLVEELLRGRTSLRGGSMEGFSSAMLVLDSNITVRGAYGLDDALARLDLPL